MAQNRSHAVMAQRVEAPDSLDFFPTPPWATRALCEHLNLWGDVSGEVCWEPACGADHMIHPLAEYFREVIGTDVHDYGHASVHDFLMAYEPPIVSARPGPDWIVTNPPFRLAAEFALRALDVATTGVALLVRTSFLEGGARHRELFDPYPPEWILQFCERVPMLKGRLDRRASSATAYCWIVWVKPTPKGLSELRQPYRSPIHGTPAFAWLRPGTRARLERDEDYQVKGETK